MATQGGIALNLTLPAGAAANSDDGRRMADRFGALASYVGWYTSEPERITLSAGPSANPDVIADAAGNGSTAYASEDPVTRARLIPTGLATPGVGGFAPILRGTGEGPCYQVRDATFDPEAAWTIAMVWRARQLPPPEADYMVWSCWKNVGEHVRLQLTGATANQLRLWGSGLTQAVNQTIAADTWYLTVCAFAPGSPNTLKMETNGVRATDKTWAGDINQGDGLPTIGALSSSGANGAINLDWTDFLVLQTDIFGNAALYDMVKGYFDTVYGLG